MIGKEIYWDTNCYRTLARTNLDQSSIITAISEICKKEEQLEITVRVSYFVIAELISHLDEDSDSKYYKECKFGLIALLHHSKFNVGSLLLNSDSDLLFFISGKHHQQELVRQSSIYDFILDLWQHEFADNIVTSQQSQIKKIKEYLSSQKKEWKEGFAKHIILKHDPSSEGKWQVFENDIDRRKKLNNELQKSKKNNSVYIETALGMYLFVSNNFNEVVIPQLTENLLESIRLRFEPLIKLQVRLVELMFQSGYNLEKHVNDVIDFQIAASLDTSKMLFITNETRHLLQYLTELGYDKQVLSLNDYLNKIES